MQTLADRPHVIPACRNGQHGRSSKRILRNSETGISGTCSRKTRNAASVSPSTAVGLYLDYSKNRITDETLSLLLELAEECGLRAADRCHVSGRQDQHHGKSSGTARRPARSTRRNHYWSMGRTSCPRFTPCSTGWLISATASAAARGKVTPESASATLSILASAAPISDQ